VVAWKALAALAILVGGAVAAFAVYTFGWHESGTERTANDPFVTTVNEPWGAYRGLQAPRWRRRSQARSGGAL
jgi:hypothetical protein